MSQKKLLLSKSESESTNFDADGSFKKAVRFKSVVVHKPTRASVKKQEYKVIKIAKENAVPYEEFLDILHKPNIFIIKWSSNTACCNRRQTLNFFEITNVCGAPLLKGKHSEESIRVLDNRHRLFMVLDYVLGSEEKEAILTVPNSSIPLGSLKKHPMIMPYNNRFTLSSDHFPELNFNVEHQTLPSRYSGALYKYTISVCNGRKVVCKLLQPSKGGQMYVLIDESVPVFQKSGILAAAIFISQREVKSIEKMVLISLIFCLVFLLGFYVVASTVIGLRNKNLEMEGKFPSKMKTEDPIG